ncbi:MAG: amidohydrolase [Pseudomonadales bacterium]
MRKSIRSAFTVLIVCVLAACGESDNRTTISEDQTAQLAGADTVYINGDIYTLNSQMAWAKSLAVTGKNISCISETNSCVDTKDENTRIVDLAGKFMLPGLHDTHTHIMYGGTLSSGAWLNLFDSQSAEQTLAMIDEYASALAPDEWLIASGYKYDHFPSGVNRQQLDEVTHGHPTIVSSDTQHTGWYNTLALAQLGIDANTPNPEGGEFTRETDGFPSGEAKEMAHMGTGAPRMLSLLTQEKRKAAIKAGTAVYNSLGITSYVNALTDIGTEGDFRDLSAAGELNARVNLNLYYQVDKSPEENIASLQQRAFSGDEMLRANSVKFVGDGVIGSTAAMEQPYADGSLGLPIYSEQQLIEAVKAVSANGYRIYLHSCGDTPVKWALEGIRQAQEADQYDASKRHTFTHLDYISNDQIAAMAEYDIQASVSPAWATENYFMNLVKLAIPDERYDNLYKFREMIDAGVNVSGGADWPTTPDVDPLVYIQSAITREHPIEQAGSLAGGLLTLDEALRMYTINGAIQMQQEDITGSLEVGKRADLVVLDKNLFNIDAADIYTAKVQMTVLNGNTIYSSH